MKIDHVRNISRISFKTTHEDAHDSLQHQVGFDHKYSTTKNFITNSTRKCYFEPSLQGKYSCGEFSKLSTRSRLDAQILLDFDFVSTDDAKSRVRTTGSPHFSKSFHDRIFEDNRKFSTDFFTPPIWISQIRSEVTKQCLSR